MKNCNEESDEGYFFELDVQYLEKLRELHNDLPFLPERMKIEKVKKLLAIMYMIKLIMLFLVGLSPSKQNYFYFLQ